MNKLNRTAWALSASAAAMVLTACGPVEIFGANPATTTPTIEDTHHEPEIGEPGGPSKPSDPSLPLSPETTTAKNQQPTITFNDLGVAPHYVDAYPGTSDSAEDKKSNAIYPNGEIHPVECGTLGRTITSNSVIRQSNEWVRIADPVPGEVEYASLTYANLSVPFTDLPRC